MRTPTHEQQQILNNKARVRVVRAAPGSGKTWLVAELIRQTLGTWPTATSGIAALSFTRVGGDEIRKAVGRELGHPHFVGTIDAFLFRYVIRPHLRRTFDWFAEPRLVVGEWGAEHWGRYALNQSTTVGKHINLFSCVCIGEDEGKTALAYKPYATLPLQQLSGSDLDEVKKAKLEIWKKRGLLTHSDAALWASKILEHPKLGGVIRAEILRRFPFLIVDELQDTGHFLGKSIRLLLEEPTARGVLVGDPDQAIYEFTGARPELFNTFEAIVGAVSLSLANSQRCPLAVARAAAHVKDSVGTIGPAKDRVGRAILARYNDNDMVADVRKVAKAARARTSRATALIKVIARGTKAVEDLAGRRVVTAPSLHCTSLKHIHRAVVAFRRGRNTSAMAATRAALEHAIFQHEGVGDEELVAANIDPREWKALAIRCLLKCNAIPMAGNYFDWQIEAGVILDKEVSGFSLDPKISFVTGKLKPQKRKGWEKSSANFLPQPNADTQQLSEVPSQTVHSVKGETHDITIFVCPPTTSPTRCPSVAWWSSNDKDREEKRIAYVAMTRTQGDLIVCVSEACYQRLKASRADLIADFECMTVAECVTLLELSAATNSAVALELLREH